MKATDLYQGAGKVTKLQRVKFISLMISSYRYGLKLALMRFLDLCLTPAGFEAVQRAETDALCSCFLSNCSSMICCYFTEEPWQRQFAVTCRETDIKFLLILFLIIPTWNIWNKTAT